MKISEIGTSFQSYAKDSTPNPSIALMMFSHRIMLGRKGHESFFSLFPLAKPVKLLDPQGIKNCLSLDKFLHQARGTGVIRCIMKMQGYIIQ